MDTSLIIVISSIIISGIILIQMRLDEERLWVEYEKAEVEEAPYLLEHYSKYSKKLMVLVMLFGLFCLLSPLVYLGIDYILKN